jgi:hypothetical protein
MESILQIFRIMFATAPLLLWTVMWPFLYLGSLFLAALTIPTGWTATTIGFCFGLPFAFLSAVFSDGKKLDEHLRQWKKSYDDTIQTASSLSSTVKIGGFYRSLADWVESPSKDKDGGVGCLVICANVIGGVILLFLLFEPIRPFIVFGIVILLGLFIWALLQ